jgi:molecular chaperone DnaK (HSP70)
MSCRIPGDRGFKRNGDKIDTGYFLPIIERNAFVPVSVMKTVSTLFDNQQYLEIGLPGGSPSGKRQSVAGQNEDLRPAPQSRRRER